MSETDNLSEEEEAVGITNVDEKIPEVVAGLESLKVENESENSRVSTRTRSRDSKNKALTKILNRRCTKKPKKITLGKGDTLEYYLNINKNINKSALHTTLETIYEDSDKISKAKLKRLIQFKNNNALLSKKIKKRKAKIKHFCLKSNITNKTRLNSEILSEIVKH